MRLSRSVRSNGVNLVIRFCAGIMIILGMGMNMAVARQSAPAQPPNESPGQSAAGAASVLELSVRGMDGKDVPLRQFAGQVLLIVNVASRCGLTDRNYTQLEPLYEKHKDRGFRILAFPCNDFGGQEPGTHEDITRFCREKYHATYDLFAKVSVKGQAVCPLYKYLTEHPDENIRGPVQWNFQKYLVGRDGQVIAKFEPKVDPSDDRLTRAIEKALAAPVPKPAQDDQKKGA